VVEWEAARTLTGRSPPSRQHPVFYARKHVGYRAESGFGFAEGEPEEGLLIGVALHVCQAAGAKHVFKHDGDKLAPVVFSEANPAQIPQTSFNLCHLSGTAGNLARKAPYSASTSAKQSSRGLGAISLSGGMPGLTIISKRRLRPAAAISYSG
jgi:hypothetical protein